MEERRVKERGERREDDGGRGRIIDYVAISEREIEKKGQKKLEREIEKLRKRKSL